MTLYKGTTPIAGLSTNKIVAGRFLLEPIWSDHIINDIQYLRADTFSWQSGDVYTTAYNKLVEEYSTGTEETEGSITFRRSSNNFKIATSDMESAILNKYNSDGIAWYYILDTTNKRFKLPRTKFGFEGLRDTVGNDVGESLPNIKSTVKIMSWNNDSTSLTNGAIRGNQTSNYGLTTDGGYNHTGPAILNASGSSSTYQDNAPVQERATQMYLYFYVGEYAREAIEQSAGITSEQLNGKVDTSSLRQINPMVESYVNGTSGYNIWANGYCEQWGTKNSGTSRPVINSFLKKFNDTNYCVTIADCCIDSYSNMYVTWVYNKTVDSFTYYYNGGGSGATSQYSLSWKASGYLAEGEY